ncbi:MAG: histidine kinase [Firmicutes bacterium HGW-Firmicutes-7]|nr:MAG: histidine kinase [Firmicutes bacterium HGW-Firmicutes-7]
MKRIKKRTISKILLLFIILITSFFLFTGLVKQVSDKIEKPLPYKGILDLSNWNPSQKGLINLNGDWEFYWQRLLTYDDLQNNNLKPDLLAEVPKVWNSYKLNGKNLSGFGAATYRMRIQNAQEGQALAIRMPTVSTAYNLYINNRLMTSKGKVSVDKQYYMPAYQPDMIEFIPPSRDFDIILQVANFSYARGGAWYPIFMGSSESMVEYDKTIGYKDLFLIGAFLIMALYYLCIFFMRKEDRSSLYFVLLCLIAIGRTVIYGDYIINSIFPWGGYHLIVVIDYITLVWFPVVLVLLIGELFREQTLPKVKKLFAVYAAFMSLFFIFSPIHIYTSLTYPIEAVTLAIAVYGVICAARAFPKAKVDSAIIMAGSLAAALGGIHDVLYQNNIISTNFGELSSFGFLILLFLQAFILARRFSEAFNDAKLLSEKLMKLDKLKDDFLANTSHELRTPLNAMINIAEGISRGTEGAINENQKEGLAIITGSGKRLTNLINDILDYSKLKNSELAMNFEAVSLKRVAESVINVLERLNKTEGVQMLIDIPDDLPDIYSDENRLLQILYNLVGNALKFTESGYIKVWAAKIEDTVEICVEDTGIGIPQDKFDSIFESFRQLEDSLTRRNEGTGLGLSITKYLVEVHGGEIWVESKVGEGSKFYFTILVSTEVAGEKSRQFETAEAEIAAAGYSEAYIDKFAFKHKGDGPLIMLVDDNEANLMSLTGILRMENYSVIAVTSSEAFFEEFKREKELSLVILDVMLPGLSGYEICREIRKNFSVSELPVLMLTARTATHDIVMGMEAGANDYLAKPFDTDELLARVKTLIQLKQSVDKAMASELKFLQAQIKPHFLYNALNTFVSISFYDIDKARSLIMEFGNYLRRSFDFKDLSQLAPLKNELELVRAYLEIEKARFEERIEVAYDLPDDLEVKVPILVLQSIVENAVIHGILPKDEGGRINICIKKDQTALHFQVKDNGIGMDMDTKSSIFNRQFGSGVGLSNIDNRLRKLYGKGLQINSIPGIGTEITWCILIDQKESE